MMTTELIKTLRQMQVLGPVSQAWVNEAANRLYDLQLELDEARAEVERLKGWNANQTEMIQAMRDGVIRQEPSRLEIAAMFFQGMRASGYIWGDPEKVALDDADKLIKQAKDSK
jgi:hypothetical protein